MARAKFAVRLHDEGFSGGALRLDARRHRIEPVHLRQALRKLSARRREVACDGEIFRADAGELPQDIRIIEAMTDVLRLDGNGGRGPKIADIDVAPRYVDQEARRQQRVVAKSGCQKLARPIEPLALCASGESRLYLSSRMYCVRSACALARFASSSARSRCARAACI